MLATEDGAVTDGGRTAVHGPMSQHVQQLLQQGGVSCKVLDSWEEYSSAMVVKLLWSSIFWLLSAALGGIPVGSPAPRPLGTCLHICTGSSWRITIIGKVR